MKNRILLVLLVLMLALGVGLVGCAGEVVQEYSLIVSSTEGGSVTSPGESGPYTYDEGEVVNLVAIPHEGYEFVNWTGDVGEIADVEDSTTLITMNDDYSITATFAVKQYTLVIHSTEGGSVTTPGEGILTYDEGTDVNLVAVADEGYVFDEWIGDVGTVTDVGDAATTITMEGRYSVTANFVNVALDFTLPTVTGVSITLSELEGTPVVLNFWSISCPWCRIQLPWLDSVAQQSKGELEVVAVSVRDSASEMQTFFGQDEPTMVIAVGKDSATFADYCQEYGKSRGAIPFTLFVDGEGLVRYVKIGAFDSEAQLWDTLESVFGITTP